MEALSKRLSEVGFGVRVRISVFVSSEINAKTPHEYNFAPEEWIPGFGF